MADANRDMVRQDREQIVRFGGDVNNQQLREKYFRLLDSWRRGDQTGRLTVVHCHLLADEFPRVGASKPRFVPNGGSGPAPGEEPTEYDKKAAEVKAKRVAAMAAAREAKAKKAAEIQELVKA